MHEHIRPDWPAPPNVQAFTTTRDGGVSEGSWKSLNLGAHCGDNPEHVRQNRDLLNTLLAGEPCWLSQVHGKRVLSWSEADHPEADAIVSTQAGQVCAILTADCLPVLFCNRSGMEIAACHAGWRGLIAGVLEATVAAMNSDPKDILAWLGPAIGPQAYEVGDDVHDAVVNSCELHASAFKAHGDRWLADLYTIARQTLQNVGIGQIFGGQFCTFLEPERFFSYRRDGTTGRMATLIWLT